MFPRLLCPPGHCCPAGGETDIGPTVSRAEAGGAAFNPFEPDGNGQGATILKRMATRPDHRLEGGRNNVDISLQTPKTKEPAARRFRDFAPANETKLFMGEQYYTVPVRKTIKQPMCQLSSMDSGWVTAIAYENLAPEET